MVDPDVRFPKEKFESNAAQIIAIGKKLLADGVVSQIHIIKPNDPAD